MEKIKKYAWCTDIHLDHVSEESVISFAKYVASCDCDGLFVTGDISTSHNIIYELRLLEREFQRPIYYVLGNHDYWGSSVTHVRTSLDEAFKSSLYLKYLTSLKYLSLSTKTAVVGHDGWYDAVNGNWKASRFEMLDWSYISDFTQIRGNKAKIVERCQKLASESVSHIRLGIEAAIQDGYKNIVVLTHVPPWAQSHIHEGKIGSDSAQPWFTSWVLGDFLENIAIAHNDCTFTVFAGHTHGKFKGKIRDNLMCYVGYSRYGSPELQDIIELP